jgi:hypothetical protein
MITVHGKVASYSGMEGSRLRESFPASQLLPQTSFFGAVKPFARTGAKVANIETHGLRSLTPEWRIIAVNRKALDWPGNSRASMSLPTDGRKTNSRS